ncbi:SpoIIE family protein phosphatase [Mycobacterium attenuatum]|uniref:SpoIIE family protein phosphatase n=1 Tax=Mycobacterium attenuatum TaxID=2341086 RepID=UPI000F017FCB|nr:SpoIIE family protein phosphatase [Mycobacterium attenuatum]VBA47166.1 Phosphoserine phosphatase RsbU [Mycobacterium attenuatum]
MTKPRTTAKEQPRRGDLIGFGWFRLLTLFILVAATYGLGAELAWHSSGAAATAFFASAGSTWRLFMPAVGFAFFPPAGVSVAAMLLTNVARWPVIAAAVMAAQLAIDTHHGMGLVAAVGLAAANTLEPLVGASAVRAWCGGRPDLRKRTDLARFVAGACVLGPLVAGLLGAGVGALFAGIWWPAGVLRWLAGDGLGALVVGAAVVLWPQQRHLIRARWAETALVLALAAVLSVAAFWVSFPPALLLLPVLAWAAFRLEVIGAALASAVLAFAANYMTAAGRGAFALVALPAPAKLTITQVFIAVIMVVSLLIGQEAAGRVAAVEQRQAEQRERTRLQTLARLGESLAVALTPEEIGTAVAAQMRHDAGAHGVTLGLIDPGDSMLRWVHMAGYPPAVMATFSGGLKLSEPSAATDAARSGTAVLISSAAQYQRRYPQTAHWMGAAGAASIGVWPLVEGDRPIGVLTLMWTRPQPLDAALRAYASAVATMVTQALIRSRAYADEHTRALVLQQAVLPTHPPTINGLDIAVCYQPADATHGLGGDWWDAMPLPKNRTYLAVGDVVGHGLPAVEDMAQLRAAGRALAMQRLAPAQMLAELNILTGHASQGKFATMTIAIYDPMAGVLHYGSAGHPPALLCKSRDSEVIRLSGGHGPVLGPVRDAAYRQDQVAIDPGDIVVLYTDGLIDQPGHDLDTAITQAQRDISTWQPDTSLHDACLHLATTLAPRPHNDDVCILAVRMQSAIFQLPGRQS